MMDQPKDSAIVMVLETQDSLALMLAKASLEEADIAYWVTGDDPQFAVPGEVLNCGRGIAPLGSFVCRILVAADSAAQARVLLEPLQTD